MVSGWNTVVLLSQGKCHTYQPFTVISSLASEVQGTYAETQKVAAVRKIFQVAQSLSTIALVNDGVVESIRSTITMH